MDVDREQIENSGIIEGRLRAIVDAAVDAIVTIDQSGTIESCNPATSNIFGYEVSELLGQNVSILMPQPYAAEHDSYLEKYLKTGERKIIGIGREVVGRKKNGDTFPVHLAISEVSVDGKKLFTGIIRDISDRIQAEAHLKESETRHRTLVENAPCCIHELDLQGRVLSMNPMGLKMFHGQSFEEMHRKEFSGFVRDSDRQRVEDHFKDAIEGKVSFFEFRSPDNGKTQHFAAYFVPVYDEYKQIKKVMGIVEDVSEKKEAERTVQEDRARLIHAEKMAALGEMAAGIAHELGTPIATIRGRMELLESQLAKRDLDKQHIVKVAETIRNEADRMTRIIRGILSFARDGSSDPFKKVSVRSMILDVLEYSTEKFRKHGITVEVGTIDEELTVVCRETQLAQVLVNLLSNACDAIRELPDRWIRIDSGLAGDGMVEISVTDSGNGVPEALREQIMRPFFTTKEAGKGTGLGLSVSRSILNAHDGELKLDISSKNTCFVMRIPVNRVEED